jgi:ATP-dependent Zn protease
MCVCNAGGLAAEYLVLGAISASAGNHDFRSVIDSAKEQLTSDGTFLPKEGTSAQLFLKNLKSMLWVVSGSLDRGGEKDWVEGHVLQLIDAQFFRVLQLLAEHEDVLRELAGRLLANRSLSEDEIKSIVFADETSK